MADVYTRAKRSKIMANIRGKNTSPEIQLVRFLKRLGLKPQRYRKDLPGSPDVVLPRDKTVLFVNGCFWHGHQSCTRATIPTSNTMFWRKKIERNMRRDAAQRRKLREMGWSVLTFWTCRPLTQSSLAHRLRRYSGIRFKPLSS